MEYRQLPKGKEKIGTLGIGLGGIQNASVQEIEAVVRKAIDNGINYFDICGGGASIYEPFGKAIAGQREKVFFQLHSAQYITRLANTVGRVIWKE